MKYTREQLRAALTVLTKFAGRWLTLPFQAGSSHPKSAPRTPSRFGPWLADWREVRRVPVFGSVHPTAQRLIVAALRHEMLTFRYWGGSTPGAARRVSPGVVFQVGGYGPLFVCGYCHLRRQERVFRVERVELLTKESDPICITE